MTNQELSLKILELVGGKENVTAATNCMTRLRVNLKDYTKADIAGLKATEGVLEVIEMDNLHVVLGPGKAKKVTDLFKADAGVGEAMSTEASWQDNKAAMKAGQKQGKVKTALKAVGDIFVPLIPGVIAAGLCSGFATLITQACPGYADIKLLYIFHQILTMINTAFMGSITAWAGYRAAEKFGATPILGGMLGAITAMANINNIAPLVGMWVPEGGDPLNAVLRAGRGGVLAVIFGVLLLAKIEKWVRSKMPDALDIVVSPIIIMFVVVIPYILVIMPITGLISNGLVGVVGAVCMSESIFVRMIAGFLGSFLFLPLVAMGMHHGLVALYTVQLETIGFVTLYPALAMAGAGQVGAAIAIWLKAKKTGNKRMMSVIGGALPAGVLGVGEPLIYGVTLPMGKPFITAGLGAGFGGAFCMAMKVAATTWGPSGVLALPIMVAGGTSATTQMLCYVVGLVISYIMGFIFTNVSLKAEDVANA